MVLQFAERASGFDCAENTAVLTGKSCSGQANQGFQEIVTPGCLLRP
jgi:hypothetical protein